MTSVSSSQGVPPERFSRAMADLSRVAPREVDERLGNVARRTVLPKAKGKTRRGKTGQLAGKLTVPTVTGSKGPVFKNPTRYANVNYWGGQTWYAQSRKGRWPSPRPPGKGFRPNATIYAVLKADPAVTAAIGKELDAMMMKHLGGSRG